jgi:hypothetical protein
MADGAGAALARGWRLPHHAAAMGFFDKAKRLLGLGASDEGEDGDEGEAGAAPAAGAAAPVAPVGRSADPRAARLEKARGRKDRPPLAEIPPEQGQTVDDALAAREAGDPRGARQILATIDRGAGLRTVLRAAAALEAGDEDELRPLLPAVAAEAAGYKLWLQVAAALGGSGDGGGSGDARAAAPYLERAAREQAPAWALAWTRAMSSDPAARREGLVELLFTDAPLARTVAARDLGAEGVVSDPEAAPRYAAFAHGRDSIRRFGARAVADLLDRAVS